MAEAATTMQFQAEVSQLLDLVIHSLYRHKEIFLRELISNASDALDKLRFAALTDPSLLQDGELEIRLVPDREKQILEVIDNGIGMTRDEVVENLGTIARSGTREFLARLTSAAGSGDARAAPELIGRFGVGFYAAFMVAREVEVETRPAAGGPATRWRSAGDGRFTVEECTGPQRGTLVRLHLRPPGAEDEDARDFSDPDVLRDVVKRHSDFVAWPIRLADDEKKEPVTLNSMRPLWTKSPGEVKAEEHADFFRHLSHQEEAPLETVHLRAEGTVEYTALLYVPKSRPDLPFALDDRRARVALYVRRILIAPECEDLLPSWLRFVHGVVDAADLPLNVSRETLQHTRQVRPMRRHLTKKVLDALGRVCAERRDDYVVFWRGFGAVLKEGLVAPGVEEDEREALAKVCLFHASKDGQLATLAEVRERVPMKQQALWYLAGDDLERLRNAPHLEALHRAGGEALLLVDPIDEFALGRLGSFQGLELQSLERGAADLESEDQRDARAEQESEHDSVPAAVRAALQDEVADVRWSGRLVDSPAVLVVDEHALTPGVAKALREMRHEVPAEARILELNARHPLIARLHALAGADDEAARRSFADACAVVLGMAHLAEGRAPRDPARFNRLVAALLAGETR